MEKLIPKLKPLISEDGKYTSDPHVWIQRFENILVLTMPDDQKITDKKKWTLLKLLRNKEVLSWHKLNVSDKRDKFTNTFQGSNETIEVYIDRLNNLTNYCEFVDRKERIRDQLVRGIKNCRAVEEIKMYDHLALDKCISICSQWDSVQDSQVERNNLNQERRGSVTCYKCHQTGHMANKCSTTSQSNNSQFQRNNFGKAVRSVNKSNELLCQNIDIGEEDNQIVPVNDILKLAQDSTIHVYGDENFHEILTADETKSNL
ncbi:hypothetical protein A3Q56_08518 [Intoshia linei]|uniref:CCHC-type domain-containing protein n=1 Tax=Intoshia linei TaxID=1819745 RepID=A0A177AP13_9BILA|nr:hypothetical protein A3Q56_08518 [Intoshia linei]